MSIEPDDILRDDFPTARKGWDPEAVRAHLRRVADLASESLADVGQAATKTPLAEAAIERVGSIIEAAERKAAEIEADALKEAERIIDSASEQASERVSIAQMAVEGLVSQADELHRRVGSLGDQVVSQFRILTTGKERDMTTETEIADAEAMAPTVEDEVEIHAEITPPVPDPGPPVPPSIPEPTPPAVPEPTPDPAPDPGPDPTPLPEPPQPPGEPDPIPEPTIEADAAARLVAMNLALGGASRDEISSRLDSEFGAIDGGYEGLLDDVLVRVG